jgi:hypothetical protein
VDKAIISTASIKASENEILRDSMALSPQEQFAQVAYLREGFYGYSRFTAYPVRCK